MEINNEIIEEKTILEIQEEKKIEENNKKLKIDYQYAFPTDKTKIPESFLENFKVIDLDIKVDKIEEQILNDIMANDPNAQIKLSRDMSGTLNEYLSDKTIKKENISMNGKGSTRSGKSLVMLKMVENLCRKYGKPFDTLKIVCANQKEFRLKVKDAHFGDPFQIDENAFANVGDGAMTEMLQLKDLQNIVAKKNLHTFYVTPRSFLPTGAEIGISYWGKDTKNWVSRFLMYSLRGHNPILLGYVLINVGSLFNDYGCFFNKYFGGCTNPNRYKLVKVDDNMLYFELYNEEKIIGTKEISKDFLKYSTCIPENFKTNEIVNNLNWNKIDKEQMPCPFYRLCEHPLCKYEHKKDLWIDRELVGGMDERMSERFKVAIELIKMIGLYDIESQRFKLKAKSGKDVMVKINLYLTKITNTKFTKVEKEELLSIIQSLSDPEIFKQTIETLRLDIKEVLQGIENGMYMIEIPEMQESKTSEKEFKKNEKDPLKEEILDLMGLNKVREDVKRIHNITDEEIFNIVKKNPKDYYDLVMYAKQIIDQNEKNLQNESNNIVS